MLIFSAENCMACSCCLRPRKRLSSFGDIFVGWIFSCYMTSLMTSLMTSRARVGILGGLVTELAESGGRLARHHDRDDTALGGRSRLLAMLCLPRRRRRRIFLHRQLAGSPRSPALVGGGTVRRRPGGDLV